MKKTLKRALVMTLAAVLLIGTFTISADAVMKRTVKKAGFTTSLSTADKKATKVKKGTTILTYKKGQGYVKFTAPKTKTYSFTFSNLKPDGAWSAGVSIMKKNKNNSKKIHNITVSTKGGKNRVLWLISKDGVEDTNFGVPVKDSALYKRTAKFKLKKGETVYVYFNSSDSQFGLKHTMKLNIK